MFGILSWEPFSLHSSIISSSSSILPFSQSIKSSVVVGDVGLVGTVEGGVAGPGAIGIVVEQDYHYHEKVASERF